MAEGKETLETSDNLAWQSTFTSIILKSYRCRGILFLSVSLIINPLFAGNRATQQRIPPCTVGKLGQPILTLAMILLAVPFTLVPRARRGWVAVSL